jgi:hypothetical protein
MDIRLIVRRWATYHAVVDGEGAVHGLGHVEAEGRRLGARDGWHDKHRENRVESGHTHEKHTVDIHSVAHTSLLHPPVSFTITNNRLPNTQVTPQSRCIPTMMNYGIIRWKGRFWSTLSFSRIHSTVAPIESTQMWRELTCKPIKRLGVRVDRQVPLPPSKIIASTIQTSGGLNKIVNAKDGAWWVLCPVLEMSVQVR